MWILTPGFRCFCSPGSTSALDTVPLLGWHLGFTSVSFCLFVFVVALPPPPPVPLLVILGGPPIACWPLPTRVYPRFLVPFFCGWVSFLGHSPLFFPARQGCWVSFSFCFFAFFFPLLFRLWLCALFVALLVCMFLIWP